MIIIKEWKNPSLINLEIKLTNTESDYVSVCNWDEPITYGLGNDEYKDPSKKPSEHPDWVWCQVHGRWHPMDHISQVGKS